MSDNSKNDVYTGIIIKICYNKRIIDVQGKENDTLSKFFDEFAKKLSANQKDFVFYDNNRKIDGTKIFKELFQGNDVVIITAEKILKIIKCPDCTYNDCILKIENYRIKFYGCKYDHRVNIIFDKYDNSQNVDFSIICCSNCQKT